MAEEAQRVADGLVAIPAQADVQQVDAERAGAVTDIQVDDVAFAVARDQPRAPAARSRCGSTRISE
jgi:hypothetical protein